MVALWLPASSHALLEAIGWIHTEHSDLGEGSDNDHEAADGICILASSHVHVPQPDLGMPQPFLWGDASLAVETMLEPSLILARGPDPPGTAPPELSLTWQFAFRASLPSRAPSMIS